MPSSFPAAARRVLGLSAGAALLMLLPRQSVRAQALEFGAMAGGTYSTLRGVDADQRTGTLGGAYVLLPLGRAVQLQVEGLASSRGATPRGAGLREPLALQYFEVPALLRINLGGGNALRPHVYAGPYVGLRISCEIEGTSGSCDDRPEVNTSSVDVGGIAGGGVSLDLGGLVLTGGARYGFGVSTLAEFDSGNVSEAARHGGWALYAGLGVRLGRR
jgi:hypothetical protein